MTVYSDYDCSEISKDRELPKDQVDQIGWGQCRERQPDNPDGIYVKWGSLEELKEELN